MILNADICHRALDARDARFDGLFLVGITTTHVYCRPVCPTRLARHDHRRFFESAAAAELAGFRPCLRCRPELAPGRALIDAVPRLAQVAAHKISAGALNGRGVAALAGELGVSERHLRRALEREIGASPLALAQTHRLLLAKRLLADTPLPVTRVAFASGFQSLRRFNALFRARYRLSPSDLRRAPAPPTRAATSPAPDLVQLTLAYRAPLAWDVLVTVLGRDAWPGVEAVQGARYGRTVRLEGYSGIVLATDAAEHGHLTVGMSPALLPVLMPLLARLRHVFDLDAEPTVVDAHLAQGGLDALVRRRPGVRLPGALDGFEGALRVLLPRRRAGLLVAALGEAVDSGIPELTRLMPSATRVAEAGVARLVRLGVSRRPAEVIVAVARALAAGIIRLEPNSDVAATHRALARIAGMGDRLATAIVMRALCWPDPTKTRSRDSFRAYPSGSSAALSLLRQLESAPCGEPNTRWSPTCRLRHSTVLSPMSTTGPNGMPASSTRTWKVRRSRVRRLSSSPRVGRRYRCRSMKCALTCSSIRPICSVQR